MHIHINYHALVTHTITQSPHSPTFTTCLLSNYLNIQPMAQRTLQHSRTNNSPSALYYRGASESSKTCLFLSRLTSDATVYDFKGALNLYAGAEETLSQLYWPRKPHILNIFIIHIAFPVVSSCDSTYIINRLVILIRSIFWMCGLGSYSPSISFSD